MCEGKCDGVKECFLKINVGYVEEGDGMRVFFSADRPGSEESVEDVDECGRELLQSVKSLGKNGYVVVYDELNARMGKLRSRKCSRRIYGVPGRKEVFGNMYGAKVAVKEDVFKKGGIKRSSRGGE